MKAKRSAVLCLGILLLAMLAVWSQTSDKVRPACPPLEDEMLQSMLGNTAWVRADWNANAKQWEIRCSEIDSLANMPMAMPGNAANMTLPRKTPKRHGG